MKNEAILQELETLIEKKHLLKSPFYQAWSKGALSKECLQEYAREYYHHVRAFPTYLSALHSRSDDTEARKLLLKNLIEEESGEPNHPELWQRFAHAVGVTEEELTHTQPNKEISALIDTFKTNCSTGSLDKGIASLYAYESQIPTICISKIEGLKKHYHLSDPKGWEYFRVHIAADEEHASDERKLLARHIQDSEEMLGAANRILDGLWSFLQGLCDRHAISC